MAYVGTTEKQDFKLENKFNLYKSYGTTNDYCIQMDKVF